MTTDLTIDIPNSLLSKLTVMADKRGVSLEALCLSLLAQEYGKQEGLIEPNFYQSLDLAELRSQVKKVIESDLPPDETRRRINRLEIEISRRYIL